MRTLKQDDADAAKFLRLIPRYADSLRESDTPFFLIVDDTWVRALISIHIEPYYFLGPAGSKLGRLTILNPDLEYLDQVLNAAHGIVKSEQLHYLIYSESMIPDELKQVLEKHQFHLVDHAYSMFVDIDIPPEPPEGITFQPMDIKKRDKILELQTAIYESTDDEANPIIQRNLLTLSDEDLDSIFNEDTTFLALQGEVVVGIVVISVEQGVLMSIAVKPEFRKRGIARKLLKFALIRLKELGWGRVYLRVHAKNMPAIKLYESFGFELESESMSYVFYP
ncbi:MAG: GNAT family N-acetyltransferase [Candidatus Thorarchaeota archaeon]